MADIKKRFAYLFKKALQDKEGKTEKSRTQKEKDYYDLNFFINGLKKKEHFSDCLEEYLRLYKDYLPDDPRSKMVFGHLLSKRIETSPPEDKFISYISETIDDKQPPFTDPVKLRFESVGANEKNDIKSKLAYKLQLKKQGTSVLDLLKTAYEKERKVKATVADLVKYNPLPSPKSSFVDQFHSLRNNCQSTWSAKDAEGLGTALEEYITFLRTEKDILHLFQVLKWMRDIVTNQPYKTGTDQFGVVQTYRHTHNIIDAELYFQAAYWILIWARLKLYMKNRWDFTPEEKGFFINPLLGQYYFSNFYNRFEAARTDSLDIIQASVLFVRLLLFAKISNATLANDKEVKQVRQILEDKSQRPVLRSKIFYLKVGRELFRGWVRIGSNMGKCNVIYFDQYKNDDEEFIYIEFEDVKNVLLRVSANRLAEINESSFYTIVWENTKHLLVLIPAFWRLIGYVVTFLTGGAFALVKEIIAEVVITEAVEHIGAKSDSNLALTIGLALFRRGKISAGNLENAASKGFKNLSKEEIKAAQAVLKLSDDELRMAKAAGKITEEEVKAIKSTAKLLDEEYKVAKKAADKLVTADTRATGASSKGLSPKVKGNGPTSLVNKGVSPNPKVGTKPDIVQNNGTGRFTGGNYPRTKTYKFSDNSKIKVTPAPKMPPQVANIGHVSGIGIPNRLIQKLATPTIKEQVAAVARQTGVGKKWLDKGVNSLKKAYNHKNVKNKITNKNLVISKNGDVFQRKTGEYLGSITEEANYLKWLKSDDFKLFADRMMKLFPDGGKKIVDAVKNRHELRTSLGLTDTAVQAHHIIPVEVLKSNRVIQSAVAGGFEFNGIRNGLGLRQKIHLGGHDAYNELLEQRLSAWALKNPNYTPSKARNFIEKEVIPEWETNFIIH
jgi:hypothetical protein